VQDIHILEGLHIITPAAISQEQQPTSWPEALILRIRKCRIIDMVYITFCIVLLTHCVLALRLQRITHHLDLVQQSRYHQQSSTANSHSSSNDMQWIHQQMNQMHQKLDLLKDEAQGYDQRIIHLKQQEQL
jgi:hypothetical protein